MQPTPALCLYLALGFALASGVLCVAADRYPVLLRTVSFVLLGVSGGAALAACLLVLTGADPFTVELPLGLPWLHWHLRLDSLSAFFLGIIGLGTLAISLFGPGYVRTYLNGDYSLAVLGLMTGLFIAGMQLVVVADDAFVFMVAW